MCKYYYVSEETMKPRCRKGKWASLKCHSVRDDCKEYTPSEYWGKDK